MNPRITLIVVAVFALLFGYLYFVELNKTPAQLGTPAPTPQSGIFSLSPGNIKSLEIRDLHTVREVRITRADSGWHIDKPESKPADSGAVDSTINDLATLKATRVLTNVNDLAQFGLVTATLEVRLIMSDTTPYALTIGDKTPSGSDYYAVYTGDRSRVFIVSGVTVDDMLNWLNTPPYEPTPTPTAIPTVPGTPSPESTGAPPNLVPTVAIPPPAATPTP